MIYRKPADPRPVPRRLCLLTLLLLCIAGPGIHAQDEAQDDLQGEAQKDPGPKTGVFTATFTEKHPLSDTRRMAEVTRWPIEQMPAYDPADHTFQLVVPNDYDDSEAYGLLVFIHPNNNIDIDRFFGQHIQDVLTKHKLIWVSYSDAGNPVMPNIRMGLALDSVHNVAKRYKVDKQRIYVSGMSGGGRMTCMAGLYYPQVFTGGVPIVGTLYFRDVKLPKDPALRALIKPAPGDDVSVWPRRLLEPSKRRLRDMVRSQRWALLAGETDYNMPQMRAHFEQGFERDEFEHAHYLEVPGMGHAMPDKEWFEKALVLLDEPLKQDKNADLPPADARTQRLAQRRLEVALRTLERSKERGIRALERLIEELPNTDAAVQARKHLESAQGE